MELKAVVDGRRLTIGISGDWHRQYPRVPRGASNENITEIIVSGRDLGAWDSSLLVFARAVMRAAAARGITARWVDMPPSVRKLIALMTPDNLARPISVPVPGFVERVGDWGWRAWRAAVRGFEFIGLVWASVGRMMRGTAQTRRVDWWFAFDDVGPRAILIVSLISFLIGLILAFVGAAQLKLFGAQVYVASLVAIASIRIMGAMMTGIIMAGRTGAAYAAAIGTMQVNEELDALRVMGISRVDFLVLPRVIAMAVSMPILTLVADFMAVLGGMLVGVLMFQIPVAEYVSYTMDALGMQNFLVGIFHGFVYGLIIALCGCYYGINCGRNATAVGVATTRAVVMSIVWMVVATGLITFLFEVIGI